MMSSRKSHHSPVGTHAPTPARLAPINLEAFRSTMRDAGAEDAVGEILATFVAGLPAYLDELAAAVAVKDARAIQVAAHAFKSSAGAIGADALATLLADLETAARDGAVGPADIALANVRQEADAVLGQLHAAGAP